MPWYNTSMCWQITAAIAASITLFLTLFIVLYPIWQRYRWKKILPQLEDIKDTAVNVQNDNLINLPPDEIEQFEEQVNILHLSLLTALADISKSKARRYTLFGLVPTPFQHLSNRRQRQLLGSTIRIWQIADEIIDKYS